MRMSDGAARSDATPRLERLLRPAFLALSVVEKLSIRASIGAILAVAAWCVGEKLEGQPDY